LELAVLVESMEPSVFLVRIQFTEWYLLKVAMVQALRKVVVLVTEPQPEILLAFLTQALREILTMETAEQLRLALLVCAVVVVALAQT
jgi:hypothetical protein